MNGDTQKIIDHFDKRFDALPCRAHDKRIRDVEISGAVASSKLGTVWALGLKVLIGICGAVGILVLGMALG